MYISGVEAADRGLLLPFLVKVHAETKLLLQKRGAICFGTGEIREEPEKKLEALRAIEMHMVLSCIAMGVLQSLSINLTGMVNSNQLCYQRTPSRERVSEGAVMYYFRKHFFRLLGENPELCITRIIQEQQNESGIYWYSLAS